MVTALFCFVYSIIPRCDPYTLQTDSFDLSIAKIFKRTIYDLQNYMLHDKGTFCLLDLLPTIPIWIWGRNL